MHRYYNRAYASRRSECAEAHIWVCVIKACNTLQLRAWVLHEAGRPCQQGWRSVHREHVFEEPVTKRSKQVDFSEGDRRRESVVPEYKGEDDVEQLAVKRANPRYC